MNDNVYEKYLLAGKIASDAREYGISLIKEGVSFLEVANSVESKIKENDVGIAFPVNIAINDIAAHFSPRDDDVSVFKRGDVVKLDVGTHVDGYIADTASTVEVGTNRYTDMIKASRDALDNAVALIKENVSLSDVGKAIEDAIVSKGYKSIDNLTGHSLEKYALHSGMSVPNVSNAFSRIKPRTGDVLAIEPFATDGSGHVISGNGSNIYICNESFRSKLIRDQNSRLSLKKINSKFRTLPFAERWCKGMFPNSDVTLKKLSFLRSIKHFPQLIEKDNGIVTQAEHTVIVTENGCEVTT